MATHSNYWSCSPFADWLRGTKKLDAGTSEEWDEWTTQSQIKHHWRYWLAEEALGYIQDFVTWPVRTLYDIKYYINNRWVTRTHALTAHARDIKPGIWRDVGDRFLPCLFNELVDFVEVETAWMQIAWSEEDREKYDAPFYATGWFRWRTWRCPQAGLDHLAWASGLKHDEDYCKDQPYHGKPTSQAVKAQELMVLYTWWTVTYRNRPDPYDASGWSAACEASRLANGGKMRFSREKDPGLRAAYNRAHKLLQKIQAAYEKEDEDMMVRLIRVRHGLWT